MDKIYKAVKALIDGNIKNLPSKKLIHGAWEKYDKQYFTDSFIGIELITPLEGLPKTEGLDIYSLIETAKKQQTELVVIDIKALKPCLKIAKLEAKSQKIPLKDVAASRIKLGQAWFSIDRILNTLEILGKENLTAKVMPNYEYSNLLVETDLGKAIILPIKVSEVENDDS